MKIKTNFSISKGGFMKHAKRCLAFAVQRCARYLASLAIFALTLTAVSAIAQTERTLKPPKEPEIDASGEIRQKKIHRVAPQLNLTAPWEAAGTISSFSLAARMAALFSGPYPGLTVNQYPLIAYHSEGPVMPALDSVNIIWYGDWNQNNGIDNPAAQQIIIDAVKGLSTDPVGIGTGPHAVPPPFLPAPYTNYAGITTGHLGHYYEGVVLDPPLNGTVQVDYVRQISSKNVATFSDHYSQKNPNDPNDKGQNLTGGKVIDIVGKAISASTDPRFKANENAAYLVLTSSDVAEAGFCTNLCGYHSYSPNLGAGKPIKFAFIGNAAKQCPNSCFPPGQTISPNGNAGADAMVSVIAHELMEMVTDPLLDAWVDSNRNENGDKCVWTYGQSVKQTPSGAYYNVTLPTYTGSAISGSRNYLIQRALAQRDSKCYVNSSPIAE